MPTSMSRYGCHIATLIAFCVQCHLFVRATHGDIRDPMESNTVSWKLVESDSRARFVRHARVFDVSHSGHGSEFVWVNTQGGTAAYIGYDIPPGALIAEFCPSVWIRSDRPGI